MNVSEDVDMYADDSTISAQARTTSELNQKPDENMSYISDWCTENKMVANETKTKCMLITTWQKRCSLPENDS